MALLIDKIPNVMSNTKLTRVQTAQKACQSYLPGL